MSRKTLRDRTSQKKLASAASEGAGCWVSYVFLMLYIAISTNEVTQADLLLENPVKLPFLNLGVPLLGFYFLAPILFFLMHMLTLSKVVRLSEKAEGFLQELATLPALQAREKLRQSLPSNMLVQFLAGPTEIQQAPVGGLLQLTGWMTMAVAPAALLLFVQFKFLPYHSFWLNQEQRFFVIVDILLVRWFWGRIFRAPISEPTVELIPQNAGWDKARPKISQRLKSILVSRFGAINFAAVIISLVCFSFPMEWPLPIPRLSFNTLQLAEFNISEVMKLDDAHKLRGKDFTIRLHARRLEGVNFTRARLGKADLRSAKLQGATLNGAQLQSATLDGAQLQQATLNGTQLQGATLNAAQLQEAKLGGARMQGATLNGAQLQGAALIGAQLQGAKLNGSNLQGATLVVAQLQGAELIGARLQGAWLFKAGLQGATLNGAQLQGADLSYAMVWRADFSDAVLNDVKADDLTWQPVATTNGLDLEAWTQASYRRLSDTLAEVIPEGEARSEALKRIDRLTCGPTNGNINCVDDATHAQIEGLTDEAYAARLTEILKALICNGDDNAIHILRGLMLLPLYKTGDNAPELISDILEPKTQSDCPVSAKLTAYDKFELNNMKRKSENNFILKAAPATPALEP